MAVISPKKMYRGAASLTNTTLYTVTSPVTQAVMTKLHVHNSSSSAQTFTISLAGTAIYTSTPIAANSSFTLDTAEVLATTETISGLASATSVNFSINGTETV